MTAYRPLPIYVISLARRGDRRAHMTRVLNRLGLRAEFVDAVDGVALSKADLARYDRNRALRVYGAEMNRAEIACCLSHLKVYQTMLARGDDMALVLEDDVECDADLAEVLRAIVDHSRQPWLVLRLQSTKGSIIQGDRAATVGDRRELIRGRCIARVRSGVLGGCGYLIKAEGARRLLRYGWRPFMPADQMIDRYWENGIDPYVLRPFPVRQSPRIPSEIAARKERPVEGGFATLVRRARRAWDGVQKRGYSLVALGGWRAMLPAQATPPLRPGWIAPEAVEEALAA